jgi:hypothetical protein
MKTDYAGIDYSLGRSNVDHETGIHYGVIHAHHVGQAWYEESEAHYVNACPDCGEVFTDQTELPNSCEFCKYELSEDDFMGQEPASFYIVSNTCYPELVAEQTADDTDIFVIKSKYYTWSQFCSPCASGAGYLLNWTEPKIGVKTYCFGHDWFEDEKAPYPVYRVEDDSLVVV